MERKTVNIALIIFAIVITFLTVADIGPLPSWVFYLERTNSAHLSVFQVLQLEQSIRTTILQAVAGLLLISGAVATWRQVVTAGQTLALNQNTRATEVFARAVEYLASSSPVTCIGGIYTLDRISHDDPQQRSQIGALLSAFARSRPDNLLDNVKPDIQTAMTVLTRGQYRNLNLDEARLRGVTLIDASLEYASLRHAVLNQAILTGANLSGASLIGADLREADLRNADLRRADLREASLAGTMLDGIKSDSETLWPPESRLL